jgi:hypothetical protein
MRTLSLNRRHANLAKTMSVFAPKIILECGGVLVNRSNLIVRRDFMTMTNSHSHSPTVGTLPLESSGHSLNPGMGRYPIFIGISGKRIFDEDVNADRRIAEALAVRFAKLFSALDEALPETPKVVLTGAAFGADLIAAEAAIQAGGNWAVAAILPFDRQLFAEDFDSSFDSKRGEAWRTRYEEHANAFERIMHLSNAKVPLVLVRELPSLSVAADGFAPGDRLSKRSTAYDADYRRNHYEQVGQYIAETSTIMIAVMSSDEQPEASEANGGTARIAACRRAGCPDAAGVAVARRSAVLRSEWPEVKPLPAAYLWLMDPHREDGVGGFPVKVLPPLLDRSVDDIYAGHPGRDMAQEDETYIGPLRKCMNALRDERFRLPGIASSAYLVEARRLRASLKTARGFDRYNAAKTRKAGQANVAVAVDLTPIENVPIALNAERAQISSLQRKVNNYAKVGVDSLAVLFVVAVLIYEIFAKFFHDSWVGLGIYLFFLASIVGLALGERAMRWEAVAEDYRAVAEMLRVQRAWYSAGLKARVDREHLQGVDQDLAPIRICATTIIAWIFLRHGFQSAAVAPDWIHVRGASVQSRDLRDEKRPPPDWIGSQLWYFTTNGENREERAARIDTISWCLFVEAAILGLILWIWLKYPGVMSKFMDSSHIPWPTTAKLIDYDISIVAWLALAVALLLFRGSNYDFREGRWALLLTGVLGALTAICLAFAFADAGPLIGLLTQTTIPDASDPFKHVVTNAVIGALVVLYAIAGALRYRMEKLNIEAEALDYRDALRRFERAERRLARGSDPESGAPADEKTARRIVLELGSHALAENESWLKSRRERPLTPVVG